MRHMSFCLAILCAVATSYAQDKTTNAQKIEESAQDELEQAEQEFERSRQELEARRREGREAYLRQPNSEEAHATSIRAFISEKQYDKALEVLTGLERLNSNSQQAKVFRRQIVELRALGTAAVPRAMAWRHQKENLEAIKADVMAAADADAVALMTESADDSTSSFLEKAELLARKRQAEILKRFPNLCDSKSDPKSSEEIFAETKIRLRLSEERSERGKEGLLAVYPQLIEEHPNSKFLKANYAEFLLQDEKFSESLALVEQALTQFPDDAQLLLMKEELTKIMASPSVERKAAVARTLQNDLMMMMMAKHDCGSQS